MRKPTNRPFSIRMLTLALAGMLVLPTPRGQAATPTNTLTEAEQNAGGRLLFDGQTTKGWRNYKKRSVNPGWKVIDGALTRVGNDAGDLITVDKFDSFELSLEYNISRRGNSGVMFHATEEYEWPWMSGPEVQIVDN